MKLEDLKTEFKNHELTIIQENWETNVCCYRCAQPGTGIFSFYVITGPGGMLAVYGDIGRHMFRRHNTNMVGWIRGSIGSKSYVLEKLVSPIEESQVLDKSLVDAFYKEEIEEIEGNLLKWFSDFDIKSCDIYSEIDQEKLKDKMVNLNCESKFMYFTDDIDRLNSLVEAQEEWDSFIKYKESLDLQEDLYCLLEKTNDEESISSFFTWKSSVEWSYEALKCFVYLYDQYKENN